MTTHSIVLSIDAERFASADGKPRFRGVALSGNLIPNRLWDGSALEFDMESFKLSEAGKKVFILAEHDPSSKVGHATASLKNGKVIIDDGEFYSTPKGQEQATILAEGGPFELSVGITGDTEFVSDSSKRKTKQLDGQKHQIGAIVRNAKLKEVSLVSAGADQKTSVTQFSASSGFSSIDTIKFTQESNKMDEKEAAELRATNLALQLSTKTMADELAVVKAALDKQVQLAEAHRLAERDTVIKEVFGATLTDAEKADLRGLDQSAFSVVLSIAKRTPAKADLTITKPAEKAADGSEGAFSLSAYRAKQLLKA